MLTSKVFQFFLQYPLHRYSWKPLGEKSYRLLLSDNLVRANCDKKCGNRVNSQQNNYFMCIKHVFSIQI